MFRLLATAVIAALLVTGSFLPPSQPAAVSDAAIPESVTPVAAVEQEKAPVEAAPTQPAAPAETFLTEQEAKDIALAHAGLTADKVKGLRAEFDRDDGRPEWEVEFYSGDWEYDYTVHGKSGKILKSQKEKEIPNVPAATQPRKPSLRKPSLRKPSLPQKPS